MSAVGFLVEILNCLAFAVVLVLAGAIVAWVAAAFEWPIPWNIQRLYLLLVLLLFIICVIAGLFTGGPMIHWFGPIR
jgi:hypothetical protein